MVAYITELTDSNYNDFTKNDLVLIDIHAVWCGPCKQLSPIIDEISVEFNGRLSVGKLDADKCPNTVSELGIRSIPTLVLYKNGEIVERKNGLTTKQKLSEMIENHINNS